MVSRIKLSRPTSPRSRLFSGEITYLEVLGQSILVLGSPSVIFELLEKRSANSSDRTVSPLIQLCVLSAHYLPSATRVDVRDAVRDRATISRSCRTVSSGGATGEPSGSISTPECRRATGLYSRPTRATSWSSSSISQRSSATSSDSESHLFPEVDAQLLNTA